MRPLLLLLLWLTVAGTASAETYRVDLIVFRNLWGTGSEQPPRTPRPVDLRGALDPSDTAALQRAGIGIVPDAQFGLAAEWDHLKYSKQFKPLVRLAWTQSDPPSDRGPALLIRAGSQVTLQSAGSMSARQATEIEGKVALLMTRYLHVDASLQLIDVGNEAEDGGPTVWPLEETRKLRRDELNHLDSPKLGILVKVGKVAATP